MHKVNKEITTHMLKEGQTRRIAYLHPNHKNRYINQSTNLCHSEHKKKTYVPKYTMCTIWSWENSSSQVSSNHKILKNIDYDGKISS